MGRTRREIYANSLGTDAGTLGRASGDVKPVEEIDFSNRKQALVFASAETAQN